jgi:hypothetical protein
MVVIMTLFCPSINDHLVTVTLPKLRSRGQEGAVTFEVAKENILVRAMFCIVIFDRGEISGRAG